MPHLSPISWPLALLSFWFLLSSFFSLIWWLQLPKLPKLLSAPHKLPTNTWAWK